MVVSRGSPWTRSQHGEISGLLRSGWSPSQIAHRLMSSGCERSASAIARYVHRVRSADTIHDRVGIPHDRAVEAREPRALNAQVGPPWPEGRPEQGHLQGHLQGHPDNIIPPIYQPEAPPPPPAPIVPPGESRVGIIPDTHLPFGMAGHMDFCQETFYRYDVNVWCHIGDLLDNHAISFHKPDPDGRSAGDEYSAAMDALQPWYKAFPHVKWVTGNHDALPQRRLYDAGLPANMLRQNYYKSPPGWSNAESFEIDGVLYTHGIGCGGINGHRILSQKRGVSCVIGHIHMTAGVAYTSAHDGLQRFGLAVGCGVDHKSYGMAYARYFGRPALGCGIVIGGQEAHFIPMLQGRATC